MIENLPAFMVSINLMAHGLYAEGIPIDSLVDLYRTFHITIPRSVFSLASVFF